MPLNSYVVYLVDFHIGKTKVFLRAGEMADLDARRVEVLGKQQALYRELMRTYIAPKRFVLVKRSATRLHLSLEVPPFPVWMHTA